jgi:hypothetical protein
VALAPRLLRCRRPAYGERERRLHGGGDAFHPFCVATFTAFYFLDKKKHPLRYVLPVLNGPMVIASTLIFSFSEVFGGLENMSGGVADTLLALVWTQYLYVLFPAAMFHFGIRLLLNDHAEEPELRRVYGT